MTQPNHVDVGPYETREQVMEVVRDVYQSTDPAIGALAEKNMQRLLEVCEAADVQLGAYDFAMVRWLASWEPETVQVVIGIIWRAAA